MVAGISLFPVLGTSGDKHGLRIAPEHGEGAVATDVGIHRTVVLDGEDMLRTILFVDRPIVYVFVEQGVLSAVDDATGIVGSRLYVRFLGGLVECSGGLCPGEIHLGKQGGGSAAGGTSVVAGDAGRDVLGILQVTDNLLIDLIERVTATPLTLTTMKHNGNTSKIAHQVEVIDGTQELCLVGKA